jgi:N4-gp56 family major capsid protein
MAANVFTTGTGTATSLADPLVNILFSQKLHVETQDELWFNQRGLMKKEDGSESTFERKGDSPIVVKDEFGRERGQRIRLALRKQLTTNVGLADRDGAGTGATVLNQYTFGVASMIDQEENMNLYDMEVVVELMKHAVGFATPELQDLRTPLKMEQEAAAALKDWLAGQYEESILDAHYEGNAAHVIKSGFASATAHPRVVWSNDATAQGDISSNDTLSAADLRKVYETCRINNINPLKVDGKEMYVLLAHVYSVSDLMADADIKNTYQNAFTRTGAGADNPLFSRAEVIFEGVAVHEYNRIRVPGSGTNAASTRRNIVLGADALICGNASEPRLVRRKEDAYEDRYGVGIKQIFGCARADFQHINNNVTLNQSSAELMNWSVA